MCGQYFEEVAVLVRPLRYGAAGLNGLSVLFQSGKAEHPGIGGDKHPSAEGVVDLGDGQVISIAEAHDDGR